MLDDADEVYALLWSNLVPSNVCAFVWKLFFDRIPSRINLQKRMVIPIDGEVSCPLCGSAEESTDHLLFNCQFAVQIWYYCYNWLGIAIVLHCSSHAHFQQHDNYCFTAKHNRLWMVVWFAASWSIWLGRNNLIFRDAALEVDRVLKLIQIRSWSWLVARSRNFRYSLA